MTLPTDRKYTTEHEWLHEEGGEATVGITEHAQQLLGDVVFVDLPAAGKVFSKGEVFGSVESVKAVSDLYAPISGEISTSNTVLAEQPQLVNSDCYGEAWMVKIKPSKTGELVELLDANAYQKLLSST